MNNCWKQQKGLKRIILLNKTDLPETIRKKTNFYQWIEDEPVFAEFPVANNEGLDRLGNSYF